MVSWSTKRQIAYLSILFGFLFVVLFSIFLFFYYQAPTCFDSKKNGDETGIDCGGSCKFLCLSESLPPIVLWSRVFEVSSGVCNTTAYVENPNLNSEVSRADYVFKIFDDKNNLISERSGFTYIPPGKTIAIFEGGFALGDAVPKRSEIEFSSLVWQKATKRQPEISVDHFDLFRFRVSPRLDATLINKSISDVRNVSVVAIVFDDHGNALGSSRTIVENLPKNKETSAVFTWPKPFNSDLASCTLPIDAMLAIDRSGSMASISTNPPQPLTDVKSAASVFIDELSGEDRTGLVSFGTSASSPVDHILTSNLDGVRTAIGKIGIFFGAGQNTNIGDGLLKAKEELDLRRRSIESNKSIILLTDGTPTHPEKIGDDKYPEEYALLQAEDIKNQGIDIYTIGLGNNVNNDLLIKISSGEKYHFNTATSENLSKIYRDIASGLCNKPPVAVEIIPLVTTDNF